MQLKTFYILSVLCLLGIYSAYSQNNEDVKKTEIDFISGYYEQDGNNSAVEGGIGSEKLTCVEPTLLINIVTDSVNSFNIDAGVDAFTSASTGEIDKYSTGASPNGIRTDLDVRWHIGLQYTRKFKQHSLTPKFAFSLEYDVTSLSGGLKYAYSFNKENSQLAFSYDYYHDTWLLIYPGEMRSRPKYAVPHDDDDDDDDDEEDDDEEDDENEFASDVRHSNNFSLSFSQVINKRMQFMLIADYVVQRGILHTPFHRVYFDDGIPQELERLKTVEAEFLPDNRYKIPMAARFNWFVNDFLVSKFYYRYYFDNFGIQAHTANLSLAFKLSDSFTLNPFYRYYTQTASDYFAPYGEHKISDAFYTSDYDLSAFHSQKFGLGLKYAPYFGVSRIKFPSKKRLTILKSIEFRYAHYTRSNGLRANIYSFMLSFEY